MPKVQGLYQRPDSQVWWMSYTTVDGRRVRESTKTTDYDIAKRMLDDKRGRIARGETVLPRLDKITYNEARDDLRAFYETHKTRDLAEADVLRIPAPAAQPPLTAPLGIGGVPRRAHEGARAPASILPCGPVQQRYSGHRRGTPEARRSACSEAVLDRRLPRGKPMDCEGLDQYRHAPPRELTRRPPCAGRDDRHRAAHRA